MSGEIYVQDFAALETLFKRFYKPLRAYAFRFVNDKDLSEDIVQDVFYELWKRRENSEQSLLLKELEEEIMSYINTLPPQCHKIFMLSRSYGLKNREIAEQLNISIKAVEKQISKALSGLKEYLIQRDLFPLLVLAVTCLSL